MNYKIRVIFIDGTIMEFDGGTYTHNSEHRCFFVEWKHRTMIPESSVAVIGTWNPELKRFE